MSKKLTMLVIMDGFAFGTDDNASAIVKSGTPNLDRLFANYPNTRIGASGMDVGLPDGQMGNSEVGHLNIGAGRIVYQELTRITKSIADGDFYENEALLNAVRAAKESGKKLHLMGLLSDGGVHSHIEHLFALIRLAKKEGLSDVFVHGLMDGRDVSPTSGADFVKQLYTFMQEEQFGHIASVCGRYYAMDRDNRWERVEKAYRCFTLGEGEQTECPYEAMLKSYENGVTDEFILPTCVVKDGAPVATIDEGDSMIFFNFRPDRAREITRAFTDRAFAGFELPKGYLNLNYVCMTQYDATFENVSVAFRPQSLNNTLGQFLAARGYTQLRIAETEKYAHVTFFFNGGVEAPNANEDRILIPSPKVATYDLKPEMSAYEVTEAVLKEIDAEKFDVIILNFANCDMVGHTGVMDAAVKAVSVVDECVGKVADAVLEKGGSLMITADHGNADYMFNPDGSPFTAHTTNPVPFILVDDARKNVELVEGGRLADIAPTLLTVMGEEIPEEMTGSSLIK